MIIAVFAVLGAVYGVLGMNERAAQAEFDAEIEQIEKELKEAA